MSVEGPSGGSMKSVKTARTHGKDLRQRARLKAELCDANILHPRGKFM